MITVGLEPCQMAAHLDGCIVRARTHNSEGIENDEDGQPVMVCDGPRRPWREEWPEPRHMG